MCKFIIEFRVSFTLNSKAVSCMIDSFVIHYIPLSKLPWECAGYSSICIR